MAAYWIYMHLQMVMTACVEERVDCAWCSPTHLVRGAHAHPYIHFYGPM